MALANFLVCLHDGFGIRWCLGNLSVVLCFLWRRLGDWFDGLANLRITLHRGWVRFNLRGLSFIDR